ncbi:FAD/NAD(P)-binding domain-containing protein [Mycena capillaripes]|nr:FAD/NAD(P)-binding domain-containing protein [Mycena capillaripes]
MAESPPSERAPLRIFVVVAGLGGLAAAVSLRRQGHRVVIFESSSMKREIGAAITVQGNAMRVLEYLGYEEKNLKGVEFFGTVRFSATGGEGQTHLFLIPRDSMGRAASLCHRTDLHDELKRLAIGNNGAGPAVKLNLGQEVTSCDPVAGTLTTKDGEIHQADLIIGADGIHALPSGISTFRCLFDAAKLEGLADMEWFTGGLPGPKMVTSPEKRFRMLFLYPCRSGTLINVVAHHVDDRDLDKNAEPPIPRWQLCALPILPTWINGRTALLGDAAHATLPTLAQGAGMALEDAATIGCLIPLGTRREDIPARLEAYQHLRKSRGEFVNRESLERATEPSKRGLYGRSKDMQEFLMGYDSVATTQKYFDEHFSGRGG